MSKYSDPTVTAVSENARYERGWYYCWLIEWRDGPRPKWLGEYAWVTDANEAIWYARKSDAETVCAHALNGTGKVFVCEHRFAIEARSALSPSPAPVTAVSDERLRELLAGAVDEYNAAANTNDHEAGAFWGPMKDALRELLRARSALADVGEQLSARLLRIGEMDDGPDDLSYSFSLGVWHWQLPEDEAGSAYETLPAALAALEARFSNGTGKQPRPAAEAKCARCGGRPTYGDFSAACPCPDCSPAAHTAQLTEERERAAYLLRIAAKFIRTYSYDQPVFYDEARCDGECLANDCELAAEDISLAEQGSGAKESMEGGT